MSEIQEIDVTALPYYEGKVVLWLRAAGGQMSRNEMSRKCSSKKIYDQHFAAIGALIEKGLVREYLDWAAILGKPRGGRPPRKYALLEPTQGGGV